MSEKIEPRSLTIRKLADKQPGEERVSRWDSLTGERTLVNPKTGAAEPWPLLGVTMVGDPVVRPNVSVKFINNGIAEGWIVGEGEEIVYRSGGPVEDKLSTIHAWRHFDVLVFKCVEGDIRYKVVHQPDKYAVDGDDETPVTDDMYAAGSTRVDHFYGLELEG